LKGKVFLILLPGFETQVFHLIFLYAVVKCTLSPLILLSRYVVMISVIICEFKFASVFPHMVTLVWISHYVHLESCQLLLVPLTSLIILAGNSYFWCDCFTTEVTNSEAKMPWEARIIIFGDIFLFVERSEISWTVWIYDENTSLQCY